jgi:hypothetical protein
LADRILDDLILVLAVIVDLRIRNVRKFAARGGALEAVVAVDVVVVVEVGDPAARVQSFVLAIEIFHKDLKYWDNLWMPIILKTIFLKSSAVVISV